MNQHQCKFQRIATLFTCLAVAVTLSSCTSTNYTAKPTEPRLSTPTSEEIIVSTSPDVPTPAEVYAEAKDRGFGDVEVMAAYDMESRLHDDAVVPPDSPDKHPLYYFTYTREDDGYQWTVQNCNGMFYASPMYIYDFDKGQVVYVEDDYFTNYHANTGKFFKTSLADSEVNAINVDRIDKETLDKLTEEEVIPTSSLG